LGCPIVLYLIISACKVYKKLVNITRCVYPCNEGGLEDEGNF